MSGEEFNLSSDKPLDDLTDDILGYSNFASNIAKSITEGSFNDGIVFSLYAEWGAADH